MSEVFPLVAGLACGAILGGVPRTMPRATVALFPVAIGLIATIVSGEFRLTWGFLLVDIPSAGLAAAIGYATVRGQRLRRARLDRD